MRSSVDEQLVDEMLESYIKWREASARVQATYERWEAASGDHRADAFGKYLAALDDEERGATNYARLVDGVGKRAAVPAPQREGKPGLRRSARSR
jgi:hypothetical protein